jgi:hypothetical protein
MVTLGVTGHRYLKETERIMAGMETALRRIQAAFPTHNWRVISCLAEGADRLLAKRLLEVPQTRLWVALPLPEEEYLKDFSSQPSRTEFTQMLGKAEKVMAMPMVENREKAYQAAASWLLDNSDCLLVIWDGKPKQGDGGTAETVKKARQRGLPLAWIHAGNRLPGSDIPTSLGAKQGEVTFERLPPLKRKTG